VRDAKAMLNRRGRRTTPAPKARHLGQLTPREIENLESSIADWLEKHNVPGSIAGAYSIYDAVNRECERARKALSKHAHVRAEAH
jgi:hypothetical protein